jgi:tetratricopeptide (TPR) repeat protein/tRNA A-37 threonylcarbamoyl transferase component Bud32
MLFSGPVAAASAGQTVAELEARLATASGAERLEVLNELAYATSFRSVDTGRRYGQEALALARELDDRLGEGTALRNLAVAASVGGDHRECLDLARQSLEIFEELGEKRLQSVALNTMGVAYRMLDQYDQALEYYERSLAIDRELGNPSGVARTLTNIANVHYDRGDFEGALELHREALTIARELDDPAEVSGKLNNVGIALYRLGRYGEALESLLEALAIEKDKGDLSGAGGASANIGNIFMKMNQLDRALDYFEKAADIHGRVGNRNGLFAAIQNIGNVYQMLERPDDALTQYARALELARELDSPRAIASALDNMGTVHRRRGEFSEALSLHRQALDLREEVGAQHEIATSCQNIGMALMGLERYSEAQPWLERALRSSRELDSLAQVVELTEDLAQLHEKKGELGRTVEYLRTSAAAREELLNEHTNERIAQLETRYQKDVRERQIAILAKDNEIQKLAASRARLRTNLMVVVAVALLLPIAWLIFRFHSLFLFWKRRSYVGHYKLVDQIATGGMGIVYRAEDVTEGSKPFALKVIRDEYAADDAVRKRFLHEAAVVDQLDHPHIVTVHERGEHDGRLFMAMELLDGVTLADRIAGGERLEVVDCLRVMMQLADVVAELHARGVVHRDLKPDNVLLIDREGDPFFVKLLDFGLARSQSLTRLTETGMIVGTIGYLAPEQITDQISTPASDVYALGVVMYEMLTRQPPFPGDSPVVVIRQILEEEPVRPTSLRSDIGGDLDALVQAMMAKDPAVRPSAKAVVETAGDLLMACSDLVRAGT